MEMYSINNGNKAYAYFISDHSDRVRIIKFGTRAVQLITRNPYEKYLLMDSEVSGLSALIHFREQLTLDDGLGEIGSRFSVTNTQNFVVLKRDLLPEREFLNGNQFKRHIMCGTRELCVNYQNALDQQFRAASPYIGPAHRLQWDVNAHPLFRAAAEVDYRSDDFLIVELVYRGAR